MISGEYTRTRLNSVVVDENPRKLEEKNTILPETNVGTEPANQLEVINSRVLIEGSVELQTKTTSNQTEPCESPAAKGERLNTTVLNTKDFVYAVPTSTNSSSILSLSETDGLSSSDEPIVPTISENKDNFEAQTVLPTTENSLLEGFINAAQKGELSAGSIEGTAFVRENHDQFDNSSVLERGSENIDDQTIMTNSENVSGQNLSDLPPWAARLKGCERMGDSYRGYVHTEAELDILLNMHKEHTHSSWGTRQSPSSQKPSVRFMWKSQYVPYDGIPFLNSGRRATVMECQYGPRRKGNKVKVEYNENGKPVKRAHRPTCPARIYIKRVRKFPEYKVDRSYEGTPGLRLAQERALTALRVACLDSRGEERFYVQFPLEIAHEYHHDDDEMIPHQTLSLLPTQVNLGMSRLDPRVVDKINELVARGVTDIYQVKHGVINFVEKDLFLGGDEPIPARHNKSFFPTITDLQNHIHQALLALEAGTLESLPPPENLPKALSKDERSSKRKCTEPRRVRAPKTALRTICIRTDDPMELARDHNLQDAQGQVYVMVPSAGSLFANSESLIGTTLDGDKATSLVQVLTVPPSGSSSFLGQQTDGTLDLTGQFLALPVVNCDNQEQTSTSQNSSFVVQGKEPISVIPTSTENTASKQHTIGIHTSNKVPPMADSTMATPIPQTTIDVIPHTITMATAISPSASLAIQRSPSTLTIATSPFEMTACNSIGGNPEIGISLATKANVISTHSFATTTNTAVNTNITNVPDLVMTSPTVPIQSSELITTPAIHDKSDTAQNPLDFEAVGQPSESMISPGVTETMTSSELTVTGNSLAISRTSQHFSLSYYPTTSSTMTSPDENGVPLTISELPKTSLPGANNDQSARTTTDTQVFTYTSRSSSNSQPAPDSPAEMQAT